MWLQLREKEGEVARLRDRVATLERALQAHELQQLGAQMHSPEHDVNAGGDGALQRGQPRPLQAQQLHPYLLQQAGAEGGAQGQQQGSAGRGVQEAGRVSSAEQQGLHTPQAQQSSEGTVVTTSQRENEMLQSRLRCVMGWAWNVPHGPSNRVSLCSTGISPKALPDS